MRNCRMLGLCALTLGSGILIAVIFPTGFLLFLVAFLLIACGWGCMRRQRKEAAMKIVVIKSPKFLNGILKRIFKLQE